MIKLVILYVLFAILTGCTKDDSAPKAASTLPAQEVAEGIYVHVGKHAPFGSEHADDIANIGFIVGSDCVAVIDTGGSIEIGRLLKETIASVTDVPVCYVINTHVHYDHVLGNLPFKGPEVEFIGHEKLADAMVQNRPFFAEEFPQYLNEQGEQAVIPPEKLVTETMTLDLGGRELELTAWRSAHTNNDLTVYDPKTRTLWAADLLFMERIPALDSSLKGWLAVLDELEKIPAERVVPGHGPASADWPGALSAQRRYLTALLEETRAAIRNGAFLDEAMNAVATEEAEKWKLADQHHRRNVSRAYRELEWE